MWIRSQDRKRLLNINGFYLDNKEIKYYSIDVQNFYVLGAYQTEARALEVLDEIQRHVIGKLIIPHDVVYNVYGLETHATHEEIQQLPCVYEMPKE